LLQHNGVPYKGINIVICSRPPSPRVRLCAVADFKRAIELAGHVRKGETGELIG
jgi:antirestriction protein ArdC